MMRSQVECNAALEGCVTEVNLILTVDFRGSILEVDFRSRPQLCWRNVGARYVLELCLMGLLLGVLVALETFLEVCQS